MLSGFLIGQILIRDFTAGITFKKIVHFWKRRWFRTLPLYYAVVLVKFLFFDSSLGIKIVAYLFFLQNNFVGIQFFSVSWSLVIEEWFYLILPLILFLPFKNGIKPSNLLYFLIGFIILILAFRFSWVYSTNRTFETIRGNFPFRFDSLLLGVLLAHLKLNYNIVYLKLANPLVFMIGSGLMFFMIYNLGTLYGEGLSKANTFIWYRTGWFSVFSFSIFLLIPFFENSAFISNLANAKPLYLFFTWTSILTYAIYLIHLFVFNIHFPELSTGLNWCIQIFLVYVFSYLIYRYYEHPMMELRDKKKLIFKR